MTSFDARMRNKKRISIIIPIALGLFICLPLNFLINMYQGWDPSLLDKPMKLAIGLVLQWIVVIFLLLIIFFWEKKPLNSIGIKKITKMDVIWGFVVLIIQVLSNVVIERLVILLHLVSQSSETVHVLMLPYSLKIFLVLTAGITEEIIFRGYLIERIDLLSGHLVFSAILSYFVFIIFHIPFWGFGGAIQIAVWTIPITILYVRRRNLTTCIFIHLIYDGAILVPMLIGY